MIGQIMWYSALIGQINWYSDLIGQIREGWKKNPKKKEGIFPKGGGVTAKKKKFPTFFLGFNMCSESSRNAKKIFLVGGGRV